MRGQDAMGWTTSLNEVGGFGEFHIVSGIAMSSSSDDQLECFVVGQPFNYDSLQQGYIYHDDFYCLYHTWSIGGDSWSAWEYLGRWVLGTPGAVSWGNGRVDCFVQGDPKDDDCPNGMWHLWFEESTWRNHYQCLGGEIASGVAAASWGTDRLDCFLRGTDAGLWHCWWDGHDWSGWQSLGGNIGGTPAAVSIAANTIECFATGPSGSMLYKRWDGENWLDWVDLGGNFSNGAAACKMGATGLAVFGRGTDGRIWWNRHDGSWSGWEKIADQQVLSAPAAVSRKGGSVIDVVATVAGTRDISHMTWTA